MGILAGLQAVLPMGLRMDLQVAGLRAADLRVVDLRGADQGWAAAHTAQRVRWPRLAKNA